MPSQPETLAELFRSLDLTLAIRASNDEEDAWACVLTRPDGETFEIDAVSFFDVDPETGDEWPVEPSPSRVLSVLAGTDVEDGEDEDADDAAAAAENEAAVRAFLGDASYKLLVTLDEGAFG